MTATASLAKSAGVLSVFEGYKDALLAPVTQPFSEGSGVDYVGFADAKSKNLEELLAAGIQPGNAYARVNGKFEKIASLEFHVLACRQLWVNYDKSGQVLGVINVDPRTWKGDYKENIEAAIIVYTSQGAVPAKCSFRTTKAQPGRIANKELQAASTKEWANIDKAHAAVAGAFPLGQFPPGFRFTVQVAINKGTAKGSGLPQYIATGKVVLTTPEKSGELQTLLTSSDAKERIASVMDAYTTRVKELEGKIK